MATELTDEHPNHEGGHCYCSHCSATYWVIRTYEGDIYCQDCEDDAVQSHIKARADKIAYIRSQLQMLAMGAASLPEKDSDVPTVDLTLDDGTVEALPIHPTRSTVHEGLLNIRRELQEWENSSL